MKYRKKPVVIEAWLWDESMTTLKLIDCKTMASTGNTENIELVQDLRILTLEGTMAVDKGDYIIKGVKGEFYPCKPDIFEMTYDLVVE